MKLLAIGSAIVLAMAFGYPQAAAPAAVAPAGKADPGAAAADERQKLVDAGALFMLGKFDEALEAAKALLRTTKDDATKTGAARIVAESLRKKCEWKPAAGAYLKLKDYYPKASDDYIKYEAVAEVLLASPAGVYPPLEAANAKAAAVAPADPPAAGATPDKPAAVNLADDGYLERALAFLAGVRVEKLKGRAASIKRARTPQEAQAAFAAVVEEMRQAHVLSSAASGEAGQAAAKATGERLAELGRNVTTTLAAKLADFQTSIRNRSLTLTQRKEMGSYETLCKDLVKTEGEFQTAMSTATSLGASETGGLRDDSAQRQAEYQKLARAFVPPPMESRGWGGFGGGFGGPGGPGGGGRGW